MADAGQFGADFAELVRHARELGELLSEALATHGESVGEYARGVAASLTAAIANLEQRSAIRARCTDAPTQRSAQ